MNIDRIEFTVTNSCSSNCKHCSLGEKLKSKSTHINKSAAISVIEKLSQKYSINSIMTFGGEPLFYPETVFAIHKKAKECKIEERQIITNGCFSKNEDKIVTIANELIKSGANSILLSVDAFHEEFLELKTQYLFAKSISDKITIEDFKLHPAWVVNRLNKNKYNTKTEECLKYFSDLNIPISTGNNIFLAGNAIKNLSQYYSLSKINLDEMCGEAPYTSRLDDIRTIAIDSLGDVCICGFKIGNINKKSIIEIIENYNPYDNELMNALLKGGIKNLLKYATEQGLEVDLTKYYSSCSLCRDLVNRL